MSLPVPGFWWSTGLLVGGVLLAKWLFRRRYRVGLHPSLASKTGVIYYRTRDGKADYGFSIERKPNGSYLAYIVSTPEGARGAPHVLSDRRGRYVCWSGPLRSVEETRAVAAMWADNMQEYIKTGRRFG